MKNQMPLLGSQLLLSIAGLRKQALDEFDHDIRTLFVTATMSLRAIMVRESRCLLVVRATNYRL